MSDLPNLLIETNEVLKNIIESKNKGDMDIEAVLSLIEVILESVIPVINFYTNPEFTKVFF